MGLVLSGISVSKGIAIGKAVHLRSDDLSINEYVVPKPLLNEEITRFKNAVKKAKHQLKVVRNKIPENTPADIVAFVDAHLLMLDDVALSVAPVTIIGERQCNAEWALKLQRDMLVAVFEEMEDPYIRRRKDDVDHVVNRIQRNLLSQDDHIAATAHSRLKGRIVIAEDLAPAEMLLMHQRGIAAVITSYGGPNSHTAILARGLGVPAIVGLHHVQRYVQKNELLVVDGQNGFILAQPEAFELEYFRRRQRQDKRRLSELKSLADKPAITRDKHPITLLGNVEVAEDIPAIKRAGAGGVGLYRTEMIFINREELPDEDEQYRAYAHIVRAMKGAPVTIRTLDLGADKMPHSQPRALAVCNNPAMGLRAIRWSLREPNTFRMQLRAILRVSALGPVRMMVPMLSTARELRQTLQLVAEEKAVLRRRRLKFDKDLAIGGMVEVPAAALAAPALAKMLDFLSIGTNDLIQYTLAVDRLDEEVNYLYDPLHPAVLRLIKMTIDAGKRAGIPVSMCGEMAGDPFYTRLLLGLGLREFSMYPASLLEIKQIINNSRVDEMERFARKILRRDSMDDIVSIVSKMNVMD